MNIKKAVDENGVSIEPSGEYESTVNQSVSRTFFTFLLTDGSSMVKPFACSVEPRSTEAKELLRLIALDAE